MVKIPKMETKLSSLSQAEDPIPNKSGRIAKIPCITGKTINIEWKFLGRTDTLINFLVNIQPNTKAALRKTRIAN